MPLKERLIEVVHSAKNTQIAAEAKALIKIVDEQQTVLKDLKQSLEWENRADQLAKWSDAIQSLETPLTSLVNMHKKVEAKIEQLRTPPKKQQTIDEATGDILEVASVDDV